MDYVVDSVVELVCRSPTCLFPGKSGRLKSPQWQFKRLIDKNYLVLYTLLYVSSLIAIISYLYIRYTVCRPNAFSLFTGARVDTFLLTFLYFIEI